MPLPLLLIPTHVTIQYSGYTPKLQVIMVANAVYVLRLSILSVSLRVLGSQINGPQFSLWMTSDIVFWLGAGSICLDTHLPGMCTNLNMYAQTCG